MNRKIFATALIILAVSVSGGSLLADTYTITDLGTFGSPLADTDTIGPAAVNNAGQMVGGAFLYRNGVLTYLGTLPGTDTSEALGLNDAGQVVGYSGELDTDNRAFLYSNGAMTDLGPLVLNALFPGTEVELSEATGINNPGQVVGWAWNGLDEIHAFLYSKGGMTDLGTLPGYTQALAYGINKAGQVTGFSAEYCCDFSLQPVNAFLYSKGVMQNLGAPVGYTQTYGYAVNDSGQVVGYARSNSPVLYADSAFLYGNGVMADLGKLPGGSLSYAWSINNGGQVVGDSETAGGDWHAFFYSSGVMTDLNSYLSPSSGWTLNSASWINDSGQIVGGGVHNGLDHGFLLTPKVGINACKGITFIGNVTVDSYNSANGTYGSQVEAGGYAGSDGNVKTCGADANIALAADVTVYGNASATGSVTTFDHAAVDGTTSQNQPTCTCDPLNVVTLVENNRPSGSPTGISLSGKKTKTLAAPGTFYLKGVSLSNESTLTISGAGSAAMFIDGDLSILGHASFIIPNGVKLTIYITGNISITGGGIVNQGPPTDLIIYASGEKGKLVTINLNSDLGAVLYAPLSNVEVGGNSAIMGKVRGMTVTGLLNAGFHYDEATGAFPLPW